MNRMTTGSLLASGAMIACAWAGVARAQTADEGAATADAGIGEIIVTARKRAELQRDVPVSIEAVSGQQLAASKVAQIIDLVSRVPTLTVSYGTTNPFAQIRGFGTGNNLSFDQAVGKFIDNVSYGRDQDLRLPLFDLERVEVLKGPQVLLYGNSSTAGALNMTTKKPGDVFAADGSVAYEFRGNEVLAQGGVTAPISDKASARLSGIYQDISRGRVFNTLTGKHGPTSKNYAVRGILKLEPTETIEVMLKAEYDHLRDRGEAGEPTAQPTAGPPVFPETNADGVTAIDNNVAPMFQPNYNGLNNRSFQADVNIEAPGGQITSTSAYRDMDFTGATPGVFPLPVLSGWVNYDYSQISQELRYSGKFGAIDLTVGGFYQYEKLNNLTSISTNLAAFGAPIPPFAFNFALNEKTRSLSGFADLTFHVNERFSIEAGARYSNIRRRASQSAFPGDLVPNKTFNMDEAGIARNTAYDPLFMAFFGIPPHDFTGLKLSENHFQPQIVAQYKLLEKAQVYAKYVKGDKAGGFDANYQGTPGTVSPANVRFAPEKAESFEVGFKGLFLDNTLDLAIAAFRTTFTNLQTNAFVGAATVSVVTNVGKARSQGIELEWHWRPIPGLRIDASGAYTDAKYLDFPGAACTRAQAVATPAGCTQDLSGTRTIYSSKFAGSLGIDYEAPIGGYTLTPGVLFIGRSHYNPSTNHEPLHEQSGYIQVDAHIDLKPADGPWTLSLFGRNLTDKRYLESGDAVPLTTGGLAASLSRGRQIGIRAGFSL